MDFLIDLLTGGTSGGIFGILGGLGTAFIKYKTDKNNREFTLKENANKRKHELDMIGAETDASIKEIEAAVQRDKIIMEGKVDVEDSVGRRDVLLNYDKDTVDQDTIKWLMRNRSKYTAWITVPIGLIITAIDSFVDLLRKLVRPVITYASVGFSFFVLWYSFETLQKLGVAFDPNDYMALIKDQLRLTSFIASTATSFWFIDKSMSRKFQDSLLIK